MVVSTQSTKTFRRRRDRILYYLCYNVIWMIISREKKMQLYINTNDTIRENDTASVQAAVDLARENGIGKVIIPKMNIRTGRAEWIFTGTVRLPSNIEIVLDNCTLVMADDVVGGFFCSENLFTDWGTDPSKKMCNIHIRGEGSPVLDGGKPTALNEETQAAMGIPVRLNSPIFFMNVEGFSVENISITHHRYWGMRFQFCSRGTVRNIFFDCCRDRRNQDGINLRNGCHDILIENVSGQTGDDMIALSAIDREPTGVFKDYDTIVKDESWDIHDITVRNISGAAILHPLVTLRNHNGAKIYNIHIENLKDTAETQPAYEEGNPWPHYDIDGYVYGKRYGMVLIGSNTYYKTAAEHGDTYNITVKDLYCTYSSAAVVLGSTVKNLTVSNVHATDKCRAILTTGLNDWGDDVLGVKLDDVILDGVIFDCKQENAAIIEFPYMREGDFIKRMLVSNVVADGVDILARVHKRSAVCDIKLGAAVSAPKKLLRVAPPEVKRSEITYKPFCPNIIRPLRKTEF